MKKINSFISSIFLKGLVPVIAFAFFIFVIKFFVTFIYSNINPISESIQYLTGLNQAYSTFTSVILIFTLCLILGFVFTSHLGSKIHKKIEKIPGHQIYKVFFDIFDGLIGDHKKKMFKDIGLLSIYDNEVIEVCFITDETIINENIYYSIFMPTGPNPTTGFIRIVPKNKVFSFKENNITPNIEKTIKYIISCGYNVDDLFNNFDNTQKEKLNLFLKKAV